MDISLKTRSLRLPMALLVLGLGALGCLVYAQTSAATLPPAGLNCVASDGKISGRGSTYQLVAQHTYANLFREDVCGSTPNTPEDAAGNNMVAYNYTAAESASATGSGNGLKAASCRTDAFAGTDIPYNEEQYKQENETPGLMGGCAITFEPPFQPKPGPWPSTADIAAPMMSFPIAGSSEAMAVNLPAAACGGTAPTALSFTSTEISRIFGGDILTWNNPELVANNASLAKCEGPITRIVRFDNSGTTAIFKNYLIRADNARETTTGCLGGTTKKTWKEYDGSPNTSWPGQLTGEGTCSAIETAGTSGGQALIAKLKTVSGGIGYADLADATGQSLLIASVRNATNTGYVNPALGNAANCTFSSLSLPGTTTAAAVGLDTEDNWGQNNAEVNAGTTDHENATDLGAKYPICGLTWDLVYSGLNNGAVANADSRLTADQRRTLYSYFTFILSSAAQEALSTVHYAPLPTSWLAKLRGGFQANF